MNKQRIILATVLITLAVGSISVGAYLTWLWTPPAMPSNVEESIDVLTSPRYKRLSAPERQRYAKRAAELVEQMPDDQKEATWKRLRERAKDDDAFRDNLRDARVDMFMGKAREWAMASDFDRRKVIDQLIGAMELARAQGKGRGGPGGPPRDKNANPEKQAERERRKDEFTEFIRKKIEQGNPQEQAYVTEFFKALRDRREELGLPNRP